MEIESFLFHIIGVYDSLLFRIIDKLGLKLEGKDIKFKNITSSLTCLNEQALLTSLHNFYNNSSVQKLREWRNHVTHHNLLNIHISLNNIENIINTRTSSSDEAEVFIVDDPDKKFTIIPLLEESLGNMKDLVQDFMNKHPRFK